jgi:hypothetical protein
MVRKGQGKIDEFAFVLLAGLIMIIVMLLIWGVPSEEVEENITEDITGLFVIGARVQDVPRHIRIGDFSVSYQVGSETISEKRGVEVRRGILANEHESMSGEIKKDMELITDGFIVIQVFDTNSEGNLVVKINDEVVYNEKTGSGKINIPVEKSLLRDYNVIDISTSGPGLKFWVTSFYQIDKVEFGINFFGDVEKHETFVVYEEELQNFKSGLVTFHVDGTEGDGDLIIEINDYQVFKGRPITRFSRPFELFDVGLVKGTNTITFSTEQETSYQIDDAEIIITHEEMGQKSRTVSFYVSSSDYNQLKRESGKIEFYILDSNYLGSLLVTITDSRGYKQPTQAISSYSIGELKRVNFDSDDLRIGTNKVAFEASGEGTFVLSNVKIDI